MSHINDLILDEFQYTVEDLLIRNKSILDTMTKLQDATARMNRTTVKAVTQCGCVEIHGTRQHYNLEDSMAEIKEQIGNHLHGCLCETCRETLEKDIGRVLFYLTSLCNSTDLNLYDVFVKELERTKLLGHYSLR